MGRSPHLWGSLTGAGFHASKLQRELTRECGAVLIGCSLCFERWGWVFKLVSFFSLLMPCLVRTVST